MTTNDVCCGEECIEVPLNLCGIKDKDQSIVRDQLIKSFEYTSCNVPGPGARGDPREVEYCGCSCRQQSCQSTCPCISRFGPNYTPDGRLLCAGDPASNGWSAAGKAILECNASCLCGDGCINRVVQNGIRHRMEVFYCGPKGWGLRTLERIEKDKFVGEYAGEVLTSEEALSRMMSMDTDEMNYIYSLRETYGSGATTNTYIDARHRGSIARFINHSCEPNLYPVAVRVHNEIARVALFAKRDIEIGEELSYHYNTEDVTGHNENMKSDNPQCSGKILRKRCFCGSSVCQNYLPHIAIE